MSQAFSPVDATRRACRLVRRWSASVALLAFQVAPVGVKQTADGKFDVGIGFGADQFLQESFNCSEVSKAKRADREVESKVASAVFDYLPRETIRLSGFIGKAAASVGACSPAIIGNCDGEALLDNFDPPFSGTFAGAQVGHEGKSGALGIGIATMPKGEYTGDSYTETTTSQVIRPIFHVRLGDREKLYLRLDINGVRSPGQVPMSTLGVGIGRSGYHTERAFIGVGLLPYPGDDLPGIVTGNIAIPIAHSGDMLIGGYFGADKSRGISVGGRLHLSGGK